MSLFRAKEASCDIDIDTPPTSQELGIELEDSEMLELLLETEQDIINDIDERDSAECEVGEENDISMDPPDSWKSNPLHSHVIRILDRMDDCFIGLNGQGTRKKRRDACTGTKSNNYECNCRPASLNHGMTDMWVHPPDPLMQRDQTSPIAYQRVKSFIWFIELLLAVQGIPHMPCIQCGCVGGEVVSQGWCKDVRKL